MDENEILEPTENEEEIVNTPDHSEILTDINGNLITINSNITTCYSEIQSIKLDIENQTNILNNIYSGIHFISNLSLFFIVCAFIILVIKYLKHLL